MFDEFFSTAHKLLDQGVPFATATVVRAEKPTSGKPGDKAIVTVGGVLHGWIGGSCAQPTVVKVALQSLADGEPRLVRLSSDPTIARRDGLLDLPMTCYSGGLLEIYIEAHLPLPRLLIVGNLPVAQALAKLGRDMNYRVIVADLDTQGAGFVAVNEVLTELAAIPSHINSLTYVVVASHGNYDEIALEEALRSNAAYVGLVASKRRAESVKEYLRAQGISEVQLNLLKSPAGLDIGARRGDEIALSIMAEIVQLRRSAENIDYASLLTSEAPSRAQSAPVPVATDPVCKMTVEVATAKYKSNHLGKDYYFCCAGCQQSFEQAPEQFIGVVSLAQLTIEVG